MPGCTGGASVAAACRRVSADSYSSHRFPAFGYILDNPILTIADATVTTSPTPTIGATTAHVIWVFGTVTGTYTGCTVQAKTSFDGANWLNLGSAASLTVTSNTVNAWDIYQQAPVTTGVTTTTVSSTAAAGFGQWNEYIFACSAYGTSAPVTITAIYHEVEVPGIRYQVSASKRRAALPALKPDTWHLKPRDRPIIRGI